MTLVYRIIDSSTARTIVSDDWETALKTVLEWREDPPQELMDSINTTESGPHLEQKHKEQLLDLGIQVELLKLEQAIEGLRAYQRKLSTAQDAADAAIKYRNEYILMLRNAGASVASMTEPLGMSRAQVNRIANPKK